MATNIQELIASRERLLRDIAHELKTPISKSKIALEMLDENKYTEILSRANRQMDEMTSELLNIEKLNANRHHFKLERFGVETLIADSLSRLFIENEEEVEIIIKKDIEIDADLYYLSIALKNLIDNALKYSSVKPITLIADTNKIEVKSRGKKLSEELDYYCELFTQENSAREEKGYGLGLSLVKTILDKHKFQLHYRYEDGENIFCIIFIQKT